MRKKIVKKLRAEEASSVLSFTGVIVFLLIIFYILTLATKPLFVKNDVESFTKNLTRKIEVHGSIDSTIDDYAEELAEIYNITPSITYEADYIAGTKNIQIRDDFTVRVTETVDVVIFNGDIFTKKAIPVEVTSEKKGISEKLWK